MKHYWIEYSTEFGKHSFDGVYSAFWVFIEEANWQAHNSGILPSDKSVIDFMTNCKHKYI